jgi:hypothetical protein
MSSIAGTAITNLRNRIEASKKAATYSERTHVDAPVHELEAMLDEMRKLENSASRLREALLSVMEQISAGAKDRDQLKAQNDKLYAALMDVTQALQVICKSPYCVTVNQKAFEQRAAAAKAVLDAST